MLVSPPLNAVERKNQALYQAIRQQSSYSRVSTDSEWSQANNSPTHLQYAERTMSTRRSTRAGSKAESSRGPTPIGAENVPDTPERAAPRRRRPATPSVVGFVPERISTSYGTNDLPDPTQFRVVATQGKDSIRAALNGEIDPKATNPLKTGPKSKNVAGSTAPSGTAMSGGGRSQGRAPSVQPDRSFQDESHVFRNAHFESSSVGGETPSMTPDQKRERAYVRNLTANMPAVEEEDLNVREIAGRGAVVDNAVSSSRTGSGASAGSRPGLRMSSWSDALWKLLGDINNYTPSIQTLFKFFLSAFVLWLAYALFMNGGAPIDPHSSTPRFTERLPRGLAKPIERYFAPAEVKAIMDRLDTVESSVSSIKRSNGMDKASIAEIKKLLPAYVVMEKDKSGKVVIPPNVWYAIKDKIRADSTLIKQASQSSPDSSNDNIGQSQPSTSAKEFERWLTNNQAKVMSWAGEEFDDQFPIRIEQLIKENKLASKEEVIMMIHENWSNSRVDVTAEIKKATEDLERQIATLKKAGIGSLTKEEVTKIAERVARVQIQALSSTAINRKITQGIQRPNLLSSGTGAIISNKLTSPGYIFPSMSVWLPQRMVAAFLKRPYPSPNPPESALTEWKEHGDCWCTPSGGEFGPSLSVIMGHYAYPDQVVVEHYPQSSILVPGSTPKDMEMLAQIEDRTLFEKLRQESELLFPNEPDIGLGRGWVRIASWVYDRMGEDVQAFPVQFSLKAVGDGNASTNKVIIRATSNWSEDSEVQTPYTCVYRVGLHGETVERAF